MKTTKFIAVAALAIFSLNACKKVTEKKLTGDWTVSGGTLTSTSEGSYGSGSNTTNYTVSTSSTLDGTNEAGTTTYTYSPACASCTQLENFSNPTKVTYTFTKGAGTFKRVTVRTSTKTEKDFRTVYILTASTYTPIAGDNVDKVTTTVSTTTEEGIYSITGGSGDIKKNSQFILQTNSSTDAYVSTYVYYQGSSVLDPSGKYTQEYSNSAGYTHDPLPTTKSGDEKNVGISASGEVWTVTELKRKTMDITMKNENVYTSGADKRTNKSETKLTLTQN